MVCLLFAIAQFLATENLAKNFIPLKTINFHGMLLFNEFLVFQEVYCHKPLTEYISFLSPSPGDEERSKTFSTKGFQYFNKDSDDAEEVQCPEEEVTD